MTKLIYELEAIADRIQEAATDLRHWPSGAARTRKASAEAILATIERLKQERAK